MFEQIPTNKYLRELSNNIGIFLCVLVLRSQNVFLSRNVRGIFWGSTAGKLSKQWMRLHEKAFVG
jgi:hypothetical protein